MIWSNFELIRDLIGVLVTCKNEEVSSKNKGARAATTFLLFKVDGDFSRRSRTAYSIILVKSARNSNASKILSLRKHACIVYRFFFGSKIDNFQRKKFDIFLIFDQNIVCGYILEPPRRGGSNEYPQSMFGVKIRKIGIFLHTQVLLYKSGI